MLPVIATALVAMSFVWQEGTSYLGRCKIDYRAVCRGKPRDVVVTGVKGGDTAWCVKSAPVAVPDGSASYELKFWLYADCAWTAPRGDGDWNCGLVWLGEDGTNVVARTPLDIRVGGGRFHPFAFGGEVPQDARSVQVRFGNDYPGVFEGGKVAVSDLDLRFLPHSEPVPRTVLPRIMAPSVIVRLLNRRPIGEKETPVYLCVDSDGNEPDWAKLRVMVDGALEEVERRGNVLRVSARKWTDEVHRVEVEVPDADGDAYSSVKFFRPCARPPTSVVTLRDDGMTLVDGKPFFPIGIYGISEREFNAYGLDRAFADLKDAGFNFGHSYYCDRREDFYVAAEKYGFRLWVDARKAAGREPEPWLLASGRFRPSILAWYLADDTSDNSSVQTMVDRADAMRMMDGTRLTCQADAVAADRVKSKYEDYVGCTDVFIPEIYPVMGKDTVEDRACVASVLRDMTRILGDMKRHGDGRRRGIWPAIQHFKGYGSWKSRPTAAQLEAMSFAALVGGANGITWYTYGGNVAKGDYGVNATREAWTAMTNVSHRVAALSDVLVERTVEPTPAVEVLSGPTTNLCGGVSAAVMAKRHDGRTYLFVVNATDEKLRIRQSLDGREEDLGPYEVRVRVVGQP